MKHMKHNGLPNGTLVRVYKNLNRQKAGHPEQWSVQIKIDGRWKLSHYAETITLSQAKPLTSAKGAERIRKNQSREVVAKIEGTLEHDGSTEAEWRAAVDHDITVEVHYNPFRSDDFTYGEQVFNHADIAYFPSKSASFIAVV